MEERLNEVRATLEELRAAADEAVLLYETIERCRREGRDVTEEEAHLRFQLRTLGEALLLLAGAAA